MDAMDAIDSGKVRTFSTGATRDTSVNKLEPFGFISPLALHRFSEYMHKHRFQSDGTVRASDNWQKGIPIKVYVHSLIRHIMDFWLVTAGFSPRYDKAVTDPVEIACAIMFNVQGYLHEMLKLRDQDAWKQQMETFREQELKARDEAAANQVSKRNTFFEVYKDKIAQAQAEAGRALAPEAEPATLRWNGAGYEPVESSEVSFDPFQPHIPLTDEEIKEVLHPLTVEESGILYSNR